MRYLRNFSGLLVLAHVAIGQQPGTESPSTQAAHDLRLVYELPIDEMQRALQHNPERSMEELVVGAVATITARLGADAKVARDGAAGFTVECTAATPAAVAAIRHGVERLGNLEFRLLASASYEPVDLQLAKERKRLETWLADGGLEALQKDPSSLAQFSPAHPEHIRWVVRRVDPSNKASNSLISNVAAGRDATVTTVSPEEWRTPPANFRHMLELIAINLHAPYFSASDVDPARTKLANGRAMTVIPYSLKADRKAAYEDWSAAHAGQCCAAVFDDEVVVAPILNARNGGRGMIAGRFDERLANDLTVALQTAALPAIPRLVRQEPMPPKAASEKAGK